jgi:hypothetical protein
MAKDLANKIVPAVGVPAQAIAGDGDIVSEVLDVSNFYAGVIHLFTGAVTTGDVTITKIEESADQAFTVPVEIPNTRYWGTPVALDAANASDYIGFDAELPFVRFTITGANTASMLAGANFINGHEAVKDYLKVPAASPA